MALANYLFNGSYTNIFKVEHVKNHKYIAIVINVFSDSSKTNLLFTKEYSIPFILSWGKVIGIGIEQPDNPQVGTGYINPTGDLLRWGGDDIGWLLEHDEGVVLLPSKKAYRKGNDGVWTEVDILKTFKAELEDKWDDYFSIDKMNGLGSNLYSQAYLLLKLQDEFKDCLDC